MVGHFLVGNAQQRLPLPDSTAQKPAVNKTAFIEILSSDYTDIIKTSNETITKIVGNVKLRHGTDLLNCDSAILYQDSKVAEAYGNVSIEQADGTNALADYLKYTGRNKVIFMKGDVVLSDPQGKTLWSEEVEYNLNTKVGKYFKEGTLQNDETIISSKFGEYNLKTKDARFKGDVVVNDPEYNSTSEDISYNTQTEIVYFYADAIVQNESTTLFAKPGSIYNALKKEAIFKGRSNIIHGAQFIEGDEMKYNKVTGWAFAKGNVVAIDTAEKSTIFGGFLLYNEINEKMMVTDQPILRRIGEKDTIYFRGDTVFMEPLENLKMPNAGPIDTSKLKMDELVQAFTEGIVVDSTTIPFQSDAISPIINDSLSHSENKANTQHIRDSLKTEKYGEKEVQTKTTIKSIDKNLKKISNGDSLALVKEEKISESDSMFLENILEIDSIENDSVIVSVEKPVVYEDEKGNKKRYFILYHNVLIYSDSAQAKCDSMRYSQSDSLLVMSYNPVVWSRGSQVLGDTIYALLDSNKIFEVYVPKNAILIQKNGPEKAKMFDQVQGAMLHAFFNNNEIDSVLAFPEAETIYFSMDEDSAYIGASKASSEQLRMKFKERKISKITYIKDFDQKLSPMASVNPESFRLSRFNWRENERPKSLEAFLKGASDFQKSKILGIKAEENQDSKEPQSKENASKSTQKKAKKKK
ncbi:MAG TPA: OstA-like protein [Edaphocola sp.]|nr:OstA-like protein [Edaphocola sp.]